MQVNYSNTVDKLSQTLAATNTMNRNLNELTMNASTNHRPSTSRSSSQDKLKVAKEAEFRELMRTKVLHERKLNERKRFYYKELSNKSIADEIVKGIAPMPKHVIFPVKVSHEQVLAMSGGRKSLDPETLPPETIKPKKWLGDGVGWEN
jgi:hypothetical protein